MDRKELEIRTRQFHIDVIHLAGALPRNAAGFEIARQLIRSAGSVAANYRASGRAKSRADFIYKVRIVLEEADETHYWLDIIRASNLQKGKLIDMLIGEANDLTSIFAATCKTAQLRSRKGDPTS